MLYHVNVCMCARMHAAEHILKLLRRDQNVCVPLQEWQAAGYTPNLVRVMLDANASQM